MDNIARFNYLLTQLYPEDPEVQREALKLTIVNPNPTSPETELLLNSVMKFFSDYSNVIMLQNDIIWEFLYIISDIIQRNNYKFKFQDEIQYNEKTNFQTQMYEEAIRVPLDVLPLKE